MSSSRLGKMGPSSPSEGAFKSPSVTTATAPPAGLSRVDSLASAKSARASPSPPLQAEADPDMERAETLISLYESRGRMKHQENVGLARARAKVEVVRERYRKILEGRA